MSQWPRGLVSVGGLAANDGHVGFAGGWTTATIRAAVARRSCARDDGSTRQGHQRIARARAHLGEPTGGAGVDGVRRRRGCGGGRSSGADENDDAVHGRIYG